MELFSVTQKRWCLSTVLHRERRSGDGGSLQTPSAWSLCGISAEHMVTNGNYICVFFVNPSNIGLLKMLPRYLSLSDAGDQIGMLLRQSRSTHPQFACDVFDRVSRGIPCIIQLQMYTLNSCWCVGSRAVRSPIWAVPTPPPLVWTWCFNATCQLVYITVTTVVRILYVFLLSWVCLLSLKHYSYFI